MHPVVEAHVAEEDRRVERLFLEAGFLDGDQPVDAAEEEQPRLRVGEVGPVAVFDGVQAVGISVGHHVARVGRVLHQSSVGAQPEVALAVVEDAVHGVGDARDERRVACDLYQSAARAEPEALVLGLVDREDVVDDGAAVVVEFGDLVRIRMRVVAYGPASAVAEPHDRIVLLVEGEEEFFDLQFLVEVESLDLADFRMGLRSAQRDAEYTAAYRSHPQGVRRRLAQRVDEPHLLGDAEAVDPSVGIGVVVQPVAVGADPQQVAAACGESVDRVVQQIAVGRGFLFDMGRVEGLSVVEVGDAQ